MSILVPNGQNGTLQIADFFDGGGLNYPFTALAWRKSAEWSENTSNANHVWAATQNDFGLAADYFAIQTRDPNAEENNGVRFEYADASSSVSVNMSATNSADFDGTWIPIVIRAANSNDITIYSVDSSGEISNVASFSRSPANCPGLILFDTPDQADIKFAEHALWREALSASDISLLLNGENPLNVNTTKLYCYYSGRNDWGAGDLPDLSVNGRDLTPVAAWAHSTDHPDVTPASEVLKVVEDNFTDADATLLTNHTGGTGATWAAHPTSAGGTFEITSNRLEFITTTGNGVFLAGGIPGSANYSLRTDFHRVSSDHISPMILGRFDDTAHSGYAATFVSASGEWRLIRFDTGSPTTLGTALDTIAVDTAKTARFKFTGNNISLIVDDVEIISVTDSTYPNAGRVGVRGFDSGAGSGGIHLDNFLATETGTASSGEVVFDAISMQDNITTGESYSLTFSHTASGENRFVYVVVAGDGNTWWGTFENVFYGGVNLGAPVLSTSGDNGRIVEVFKYIAPPVGAQNVVIQFDASGSSQDLAAAAISYTNVDQTAPSRGIGEKDSAANGTPISLDIASASGDMVLNVLALNGASAAGDATATASQTSRGFRNFNGLAGLGLFIADKPGSASTNLSWTTNDDDYSHAAFSLQPVPGSAGYSITAAPSSVTHNETAVSVEVANSADVTAVSYAGIDVFASVTKPDSTHIEFDAPDAYASGLDFKGQTLEVGDGTDSDIAVVPFSPVAAVTYYRTVNDYDGMPSGYESMLDDPTIAVVDGDKFEVRDPGGIIINLYNDGTYDSDVVGDVDIRVLDISDPTDGKDGTWTSQRTFTTQVADTTAPTLSNAVGASTGTDTADGSVDTDEGDGTAYAVLAQSMFAPTPTQVQAGQDDSGSAAAYSASQAVGAAGTLNFAATGLTAATNYHWHFQHQDAAGNDSTVITSAQITTDGVGSAFPTADAGPDQSVDEGDTVTLTAAGSSDDVGIATYAWTQTGGTAVTLSDTSAIQPTFTAPGVDEALAFQVEVTDGDGQSSTDSVTINVATVLSQVPIANAGQDVSADVSDQVTLNGSGSSDDESIVSYLWEQVAGVSVTLSSPNSVQTAFIVPAAAEGTSLTFRLTVEDADQQTSTDNITVQVAQAASSPGYVSVLNDTGIAARRTYLNFEVNPGQSFNVILSPYKGDDFVFESTAKIGVYGRSFTGLPVNFGGNVASVTWPAGAPYPLPKGFYYVEFDLARAPRPGMAQFQRDSNATSTAQLRADFNTLLERLRDSKQMEKKIE